MEMGTADNNLNTADRSCFENLFQDNSTRLVNLPVAGFCRQKQDRALTSYQCAHESFQISNNGCIRCIYKAMLSA